MPRALVQGLVPGSLATVFGMSLTSFSGIVPAPGFPLPVELAGTVVTLNGTPVPLIAVANAGGQEQVNFRFLSSLPVRAGPPWSCRQTGVRANRSRSR